MKEISPDPINQRLMPLLECPRCHSALASQGQNLVCQLAHENPVVNGVPVFIIPEADQTIDLALVSHEAARTGRGGPLYLETLGLSDREKDALANGWDEATESQSVDLVVSYLV